MVVGIPTIHESVGISVQPYPPLWSSSRQTFPSFTDEIQSYSHELALENGLYRSAEIGLSIQDEDVMDWLERGLGRHIVTTDGRNDTIFEGFVNTIRMSFGNVTLTYGPVMNVANRVKVQYTPFIDVAIDPPVSGNTTETIYAEDTDSQSKYGIHEVVVDGGTLIDSMTRIDDLGTVPDSEAEFIRDAYLEENKSPEVSHELSFSSPSLEIKLEVAGYALFFDKHIYNDDTIYTVQIPTKIQNVVDANPNTSIFSTDYGDIATDPTYLQLTSAFEDKNRTAGAILKELMSMGNSTNDRTIFLVRKDRKVYYRAIPSQTEYYYDTNQGIIMDRLGNEVMPWQLLPGKWVEFIGLRSVPQGVEMRGTFRRMFIETVSYRAPFDKEIGGNKVSKVSQILAKKGLG